jgi:hypothetical protein
MSVLFTHPADVLLYLVIRFFLCGGGYGQVFMVNTAVPGVHVNNSVLKFKGHISLSFLS